MQGNYIKNSEKKYQQVSLRQMRKIHGNKSIISQYADSSPPNHRFRRGLLGGRVKIRWFNWFLVMGIFVLANTDGFAEFGPLQTMNRFPLHLLFLKPRPVSGELPAYGTLETTMAFEYSNTYFDYENHHWNVLMDMEMMVSEFCFTYGIQSNIAIGFEVPLVSMSNGFLDGLLENYHDTIGVSNYHRENRPKNDFAYRLKKDNALLLQGETGNFEIADVTAFVQYKLLKSTQNCPVKGSFLSRVKLPLGDQNKGLGSGQFDIGVYLPIKYAKKKWSFFFMPGVAYIGDPEMGNIDWSARNSYSLFGGVAYEYSAGTTLLAQLSYYTSPIEKTGLNELDRGALELDFGFHHQLNNELMLELAFCEDLTLAVPDFNLRIGFCWTKKR